MGAAKYCCEVNTSISHIAAVCNRAGWTMGEVRDTYLQYTAVDEQEVARVVAGLT